MEVGSNDEDEDILKEMASGGKRLDFSGGRCHEERQQCGTCENKVRPRRMEMFLRRMRMNTAREDGEEVNPRGAQKREKSRRRSTCRFAAGAGNFVRGRGKGEGLAENGGAGGVGTRTVRRKTIEQRWDPKTLELVGGVLWRTDSSEGDDEDRIREEAGGEVILWRMYIKKSYFEKHGYTVR